MSRRRVPNESASSCSGTPAARPGPGSSSTFNVDAHSLSIGGGEFNNTQGHRTNLNIYVNSQSPFLDGNDSNQASTLHTRNTRTNTLREPRPRASDLENSTSSQLSVQQSNVIYQRHLELKGLGFPLWIPPAKCNLSIQYRRTGVRIGDVGIITPNGGFSFLFNICLPRDDPINAGPLPENFSPISETIDIDSFIMFGDGSHLASTAVEKARANSQSSGLQFESAASEGAILTMPLGATSQNLGNVASFRRYIASNLVQWYKLVNGVLGREAKNGDIRLVTGSVKTTSWGIATFANQTRQSNCRLSFCPLEVPSSDSTSSDSSRYGWEYSGIADVRAGPSQREKNELRHADEPGDAIYENQCLFLRTMNPKLPPTTWSEINRDPGSGDLQLRPARDSASTTSSISPTSARKNQPSTLSSQSSHKLGNRRCLDPHPELKSNTITIGDKSAVLDSDPLSALISHPSNALNDILIAMVPAAHMVITHDEDWSSVVSEYDTIPDPHELLEQILISHRICEEDGVIFLCRQKAIENGVSNEQGLMVKNQHAPPQDASTPPGRVSPSGLSTLQRLLQQQSEKQAPNPSSPDIMMHPSLPSSQDNKDDILGHDHTFKQAFVDDYLQLSRPPSVSQQYSQKQTPNTSNPGIVMHSSLSYPDNKDAVLGQKYAFKQESVHDCSQLSKLPASASSVPTMLASQPDSRKMATMSRVDDLSPNRMNPFLSAPQASTSDGCRFRRVFIVYVQCGHRTQLPDEEIFCYNPRCKFSPSHPPSCRPPSCLQTCRQQRLSPEQYTHHVNAMCPDCLQGAE